MKGIYRISILFFIPLLIFGQSNSKLLKLDDAISIALNRNSNLIKSTNNILMYEKSVKNAYGELLPTLGVNGSFNWSNTSDEGGMQVDFWGNEYLVPPTNSDARNWSLGVGGNVVLFNGLSNYNNITKNKKDLESAEFSIQKLKQDIVLETTRLYLDVLYNQELLKVSKDNLEYNKKFLETVEAKNQLGSASIADVYAQQVRLGNAELSVIQTEKDYEVAISNLLDYLALNVLDKYEFQNPYVNKEVQNPIIEEIVRKIESDSSYVNQLIDEALENRPDYKSQILNVESKNYGMSISKSALFPTLTGNYYYSTSATQLSSLFNRRVFSLGLSLNIPIFSNWSTEYSMQVSEIQLKNSQEDLNILERQIKMELKKGYLDYITAKKKFDVSNKNVISAEENRKVNNERYNLGSGTILDILQSDKDYTEAISNKLSAQFEYYLYKEAIVYYLGRLDISKYE
ncbi:MAG: TolC family protein [Ignavibacteriales bacterium]|nr:TolC family protein [Ignavibacteriales bacterium]